MEQKAIKAFLAMTREDHDACGGTLTDNMLPGIPEAATLSNVQLKERIRTEKQTCDEVYEQLLLNPNDPKLKDLANLVIHRFLGPNVEYLRQIGRLPEEFKDFDVGEAYPAVQKS